MKIDRSIQLIRATRITEKSTRVQADRQYVFCVARQAGKKEISQAVELLFDVKVESVRTINMLGKKRNFRGIRGRLNNWKKAYVTVAEGYSINLGGN